MCAVTKVANTSGFNVVIMGHVTLKFSLGCYVVCCSIASLAVGCSHLYSFASYDRP